MLYEECLRLGNVDSVAVVVLVLVVVVLLFLFLHMYAARLCNVDSVGGL